MNNWLDANWPAPNWLHAGTTYRSDGISRGPYTSLNLAGHVGDAAECVIENRKIIRTKLKLPSEPYWLNQIHGDRIVEVNTSNTNPDCDGAYTNQNGTVVAVLTADCLPLLLCNTKHRRVAAIHVGWRGLCKGIVQKAIELFSVDTNHAMAWLGPCIGPEHYEVDATVRDACLNLVPHMEHVFIANRDAHWLFDLQLLVAEILNINGIRSIHKSESCTYAKPDRWYSFRREGKTGRMASLIWMSEQTQLPTS